MSLNKTLGADGWVVDPVDSPPALWNATRTALVDPVSGGDILYTNDRTGDLTCLYRLQEADGSLFVDSMANGPDMVIEGTLGAARTANAGYLTPNGTDNYARNTDLNSVLAQILDFRNTDDSAISFGFEIINATDFIAASQILGVGGGASGEGRFAVQYSTVESLQVSGRGIGETLAPTLTTVIAADTTGVATKLSVLLVMHSPSGYTYQMDAYVGGIFSDTYVIDFNQGGLATSMPYATPNGVTFFGSQSLTPTQLFNASGVTLAGLRNLFLRRATHDAAQEARIASDLYFFPGEWPATLRR